MSSFAFAEEVVSEELPAVNEPLMNVEHSDGLLSVGLENAPFGKVMREIANRAGFEVEVSRSIGERTLNTRFEKVELKRAILRLLSLIGQKTYFMHYDKQGEIKKIEVYGTASEATKKPPQTQLKRAAQPKKAPTRFVHPYVNAPTLPEAGEEGGAPSGPEAPYIPPKEAPVFIPPPPTGR